jgi:probable biosynthetic protein (TIGR04099 family)
MEQQVDRYVAGMPQLSYTGLSENWLLKECGHRHWMALAALDGVALPDFRDDAGNKAYAAFTAVRIGASRLDRIVENEPFSITTRLGSAGRARHCSVHEVQLADGLCGRVEMLSTFVGRREERNNRSVMRAPFARLEGEARIPMAEAVELAALAKRFRAGDWSDRLGLTRPQHSALHETTFLPCPNTDFNGADFLYFASFQAFIDRAEWGWFRFSEPPLLSDRELFFYGNVNVGEELAIRLGAVKQDETGIVHCCEIYRGADDEKIADVVTRKRWRQR